MTSPEGARLRAAGAIAIFLISLAVYVLTLAPTVTFVDSGELILATKALGVAHPPGFPLYLILTHLASVVPVGSIAARVNFASALYGALAASVIFLLVVETLVVSHRRTDKKPEANRKKKHAKERAEASLPAEIKWKPPVYFSAFLAALVFACSRTVVVRDRG